MGATSPEERNHVYSMRDALVLLAAFAGSLVGGLMPGLFATALGVSPDHPAAYRYPLVIAAVLLIPAVLAMWATREVSVSVSTSTSANAGDMQEPAPEADTAPFDLITLLALVVLLQVAGGGVARIFFNVYLDAGLHIPTAQIGALAAAGQLLAVPAALTMPLLVTRWGKSRTYVLASFGMVFSLLPLALVPHWGAAGLGYMGIIALAAITGPAFGVYHMEIVAPRWRATTSGATTMAFGLSWSAMALGGGYIITALGYRSLFLIGTGLTAAGALLFWVYFHMPRGDQARRSTQDKPK